MRPLVHRNAPTSGSLAVWQSRLAPGIIFHGGTRVSHPFPRHWHDELHICAYTAGVGYLACRGSSRLVGRGDLVITPPGEVHENWVESGATVSFYSAYVDRSLLRTVARDINQEKELLPAFPNMFQHSPRMLSSFLSMVRTIQHGESRLQCDELLRNFLSFLFLTRRSNTTSHSRAPYDHTAVTRAREYIAAHFTEPITLAQLGRVTDLSPFHLQRIFFRKTGLPPHAYQTQLRINRAKELLRQQHALCEIAITTGFADQSHLTRQFRRLVGITPGRYAAEFSRTR
ncbi:MAG: AraC family transcriptional regulator [Acidobacteria bacterium]|nr:AraC family transcriptional regulator [Acidobacteriota bacterium]